MDGSGHCPKRPGCLSGIPSGRVATLVSMYLVHASLRTPPHAALPADIGTWTWAQIAAGDGVEHIVVHADAQPYPVLGLYVLADRLERAEAVAAQVCRGVLRARAELAGWEIVDIRAPMVAPFYESLLAAPARSGLNRPGPDPSNRTSFRPH